MLRRYAWVALAGREAACLNQTAGVRWLPAIYRAVARAEPSQQARMVFEATKNLWSLTD